MWSKIENGLPEPNKNVLVCNTRFNDTRILVGWYGDNSKWYVGNKSYNISHWMPLPELPTKDTTSKLPPEKDINKILEEISEGKIDIPNSIMYDTNRLEFLTENYGAHHIVNTLDKLHPELKTEIRDLKTKLDKREKFIMGLIDE